MHNCGRNIESVSIGARLNLVDIAIGKEVRGSDKALRLIGIK